MLSIQATTLTTSLPGALSGLLAAVDDTWWSPARIELASWLVWSLFLFAFGASIGSFVNVIAVRLPRGGSIVLPPSRCPACGGLLTWRENLPVLGWLLLRGRCARCRTPISPQYVLVELLLGLLFVATFLVLYLPAPGSWWLADTAGWWTERQFSGSYPGFLVVIGLISALLPITLIDARTFMIPLSLTVVVVVLAVVLWPLQASLTPGMRVSLASPPTPLPTFGAPATGATFGGMAGVLVLAGLLRAGWLRPSFADYEEFVPQGEVLAEYPHARREAGREILHLLPIVVGLGVGWAVGGWLGGRGGAIASPAVEALGGVLGGYLIGGGVAWGVRILGTLGFGREAMGLGDVHLMGAIGAALGWQDAVATFLIAPFLGLAWAAAAAVLGSGLLGERGRGLAGLAKGIPYGPHLAFAAVLVVLLRPAVVEVRELVLPSDREGARSGMREGEIRIPRRGSSPSAGRRRVVAGSMPVGSRMKPSAARPTARRSRPALSGRFTGPEAACSIPPSGPRWSGGPHATRPTRASRGSNTERMPEACDGHGRQCWR